MMWALRFLDIEGGRRRRRQLVVCAMRSVCVHMYRSLVRADAGAIATWGASEFGQLGQGRAGEDQPTPRVIKGTREVFFTQARLGSAQLASWQAATVVDSATMSPSAMVLCIATEPCCVQGTLQDALRRPCAFRLHAGLRTRLR